MIPQLPKTDGILPALMTLTSQAGRIAITSHQNPDGDGHVAALALQRFLSCKGIQADIVTDGDDLKRFDFLGETSGVVPYSEAMSYDLLIVLDCNSMDRLGLRQKLVSVAKATVVIDHHVLEHNPIPADYHYIETAYVSVGAILFRALETELALVPDNDRLFMANCFWTTILNDTNNFTNANTDSFVFAMARDLMAYGIKPHILYKEFFQNHSAAEMRFVGETLSTIRLHLNDRILFMHSTKEMQLRNGIEPEAIMSVTRWVQGTAGLDAIVYFCEKEPGIWKLSLRSLKLNVQAIAAKYGGGGHIKASGCTIEGSLSYIEEIILADLTDALANHA